MAELLSTVINRIKQHVEGLIDEKYYIPVPKIEDLKRLNETLITYADVEWLEEI